jgi:hypothetical protein
MLIHLLVNATFLVSLRSQIAKYDPISKCRSKTHFSTVLKLFSLRILGTQMDLFPNKQNFDLDKSRHKFHHSLKEHHKISNIPTFRCEML